MSEISHPFIEETVNLYKKDTLDTKNKVIFIPFNHTNRALQKNTKEKTEIEKLGFKFAFEGINLIL